MVFSVVQTFAQAAYLLAAGLDAGAVYGGDALEGVAQLLHLARVGASHGHLRYDAFEVAHLGHLLGDEVAEGRAASSWHSPRAVP